MTRARTVPDSRRRRRPLPRLDQVLADLPGSGELATVPTQSAGRLLVALKGGV